MTKGSALLTAVVVTASLVAGAPTVHGWDNSTRLTYLTFSAPVALPGTTLKAGTYAFELASPLGASNVVMVRSRSRNELFFMGFTQRVARSVSARSAVTLGESASGEPKPITVWYPPDMSEGLQFIYRE
jgi:hypothetical protein